VRFLTASTSSSPWDRVRRSWADGGPTSWGHSAEMRGGGNDLIHGGPGHDVIYGGPGNDLVIDTKGTATISTGAGRNEVEVADHSGRDQVLCARGSIDRIYADRGDKIVPACRRAPGSRVVYHRPPPTAADNAQVARDLNGCTNNPNVDCELLAASGGPLNGFWSRQSIPQRQCPPDHPYLRNVSLVPWGTTAPNGVEMVNLGNVGFFAVSLVGPNDYVIGTQVGEVTNWTFKSQGWEMWFHCTSDATRGYILKRNIGSGP
jgi:RTX calcium-binding nonapeptide repeat (4 copies)